MSLTTPESVRKLQRALYAKAKADPEYRFYALYDKIHRKDVLEYAWRCCRANKGAAGVDQETFERVEAEGVEGWLDRLAEDKAYRAIDTHARHRLRQWLRRKHRIQGQSGTRFSDEYFYKDLGLLRLEKLAADLPWAKA